MNQSVDLMNSKKRLSFRHNNISSAPKSIVRRAMLLMLMLLMGVGSAWGQTFVPASLPSSAVYSKDMTVSGLTYEFDLVGQASAIQGAVGGNIKYARWFIADSDNNNINSSAWTFTQGYYPGETSYWFAGTKDPDGNGLIVWNINWGNGMDPTGEYSRRENILKMTITAPTGTDMTGKKVIAVFSGQSNYSPTEPTLQAMCIFDFPAPDTFESELKVGGRKGVYLKDYVETETTSAEVEFTRALELVGSGTPKYARFILMKGGKAVDPTGKLTISGATPAPQQTSKPKQGYYLYNSGNDLDLSGLSVTVNGADYADYRVVCLLSTDAAAAATGNVVETEPQWDVQYTYSFTKVTTLPSNQLANPYIRLNIHQMVLDYFGKTEDEMKDVWHADWSVRDKKTRAIQTLQKGSTQGADVWSAYVGYWNSIYQNGNDYGATLNQNYIYAGHLTAADKSKDKLEAVKNMLGYLQIYAPSAYATIQGASDYEIVYQVTDDYHGGMPTMTSRFVFRIPPFENEANTGMTTDVKPQTVPDRTQSSFTLADMPTDAKYARFYLTDVDGNAIDPSSILSVTGGVLCGNAKSGYYLYNNGSVLAAPTVAIAAPYKYKTYKVVGLFSTNPTTDMDADGTTVNHEPKWDMMWTYTFDYNITTNAVAKQIEWDATAMAVDASSPVSSNDYTDWNTSMEELMAGQYFKWYVTDGAATPTIQPLAIGSERQNGTWTISLPSEFVVTGNVASLYGKKVIEAQQIASWVTANAYAPLEATYADVSNHEIICEVYTNNAGTGDPNVRYTFSIHKGFLGSLKNGVTETTKRVLLPTADVTEHTFTTTVPKGTKYTRAYLLDKDGTAIDPTGKLTMKKQTDIDIKVVRTDIDGGSVLHGVYCYMATGEAPYDVEQELTLKLTDATLDQYQVVVVTSTDAAVVSGSDVTSEPDWDSKTTYWFKYPAATKSSEANVEWDAVSMQLTAPAIESTDNLGEGYLAGSKSHYTMQWYVVDKNGVVQNLRMGTGRVNDWWSMTISGSPFTVTDNVASVSNNDGLSTASWAAWAAPVFYAPKNQTITELYESGVRFVCKFYEDDQSPLTDDLLAFTYTVYIDKQQKMGQLKDGGQRGSITISEGLTSTTTSLQLDLTPAIDGFKSAMGAGSTPRYARIYLTKSDGTVENVTTALTGMDGFQTFQTTTDSYYKYDASGLTLPTDATLSLPAAQYSFYHLVVCLSGDDGEDSHIGTGELARRRAATKTNYYEPDYDYIFTFKFAETSTFPGTLATDRFQHAKEILVANESVAEVAIPLSENINKIKKELGASTWLSLAGNFHVRWYLVKRDENGDYAKIPNSENYLMPTSVNAGSELSTDYYKHISEENYGLYWNSVTSTAPGYETDVPNILDVKVTKPSLTDSWEDYRLMVVMSNDLTVQTDDGGDPKKLIHEPDNLKMLYIYNFFVEHDFQFVHSVGESERPYVTRNGADIDTKDSRINASVQQYSWDNSTGSKVAVSEDIRQGVHTVEYDIYVDPTSSTPINLKLPFEGYYGDGDVLEPAAYIRWYDWITDINNPRLAIADNANTLLEDMTETNQGATVSRGLFMLNNSVVAIKPIHQNVGVTFNPSGLNEQVTIACDVSKYYDGIYGGSVADNRPGFSGKMKPYLMHEPTLSTRYIFNIRPASVIATDIQIGQQKFDAKGADMFQLAEDNGRVSVAMKDNNSEFSIRANLSDLNYYYIYNGTTPLKCSKIGWYAYYEDESGIYRNDTKLAATVLTGTSETNRISLLTVGALSGTYTSISGGTSKSITATYGQRFHLVGYIGDGSAMAPVVHYEVNLIEAPGYSVSDLPLERTEAYLREHMTLQATVDFDGLCGTELSTDLSDQSKNHSTRPLPWDEAQYGFCYPDVRRIHVSNDDMLGISPLHGDYMLLRSMNKSFSPADYKYNWWDGTLLYDYTYNHGLGLDGRGTAGEHGSFLYVDASDESRTIAKMDFTANLCAGSELCFTGFIANMTSGTVQPQVMATVYAVMPNGDRTRVVSFHSSNLSTMVNGEYKNGKWYQVYGRVAIPSSVKLTGVDHYEVDIDNYSPGTKGADYAVDQLQFFTSNAKLKVKQQDVDCGDASVKVNIFIDADGVKSNVGKNIYWRICDEDGNPITDPTLYGNPVGGNPYGTTAVPATAPATVPNEATFLATSPNSGYFVGTDGQTYFSLASRGFALEQGVQYYVSVYSMGETAVTDEDLWAKNTDACATYSPIFVPKMMYLTMEDNDENAVTSVSGSCTDQSADIDLNVVLNMPDDDEISGFKRYDGVHFDYFLGTIDEFRTYSLTSNSNVLLSTALADYRGKNGGSSTYRNETSVHADYATANADYAAVINQAISEGKLILSASSRFTHPIKGDNDGKAYIAALPIEDVVNNGTSDFHICSPLEFVFNVDASGNAPTLVLGFEDVEGYPDAVRVVRVGKEQLANMQQDGSDGFILHIPVHTFKRNASATDKEGTLTIQGDLELLMYQGGIDQTTDSKITANIAKVATFESTTVNSGNMYIAVNFHGTGVTKPTFYEGFAYRMFFQVKDASDATACEGNVEFLLKVVPEFVTWNGNNTNWNNDANWRRSERAELNKGEVTDAATATNHATDGHPNGYKNNSEQSVTVTPNTYVPMKFTYVTLPTGLRAPVLQDLAYDGTTNVYSDMGTGATANIAYDLMVRYTEQTCVDHSISGKVYDCEKFYGNWAKELYLKPGAELLNQQYLTYEKVWVEKELKSNTWSLMSTPLQNTYAGDMYVPYDDGDATKNGRQLTEAFQPISFSTTSDAAGVKYSRTRYPIYQKGWTQQGVYVWTKTNDVRQSKYSANIPGGVSTLLNQWSHSYNDVTVPYSTWTAFAIRPHKQPQTANTLIRLPKDDTSFDYYQWDNTSPTDGKLTQAVSKPTKGKLLTDGTANIDGVTYGTAYSGAVASGSHTTQARTAGSGTFGALVANIQSSPADYQLVGNPYLCSIDMSRFVAGNSSNLETGTGYWTYTDNNTGTPLTSGVIGPMQSFFVKVKSGGTQVTFTPDMMVDGAVSYVAPAARMVTLTAENGSGQSAAGVAVANSEQQGVEALFDSNLSDVPMVFTVGSDGRAMSINSVAEMQPVSFGVSCAASDEAVTVTVSGTETVGDGLCVVDAVTGEVTAVYEGSTISVQPNDYGRYFLTTQRDINGIGDVAAADAIVVSTRQGVVTVRSKEPLTNVRVTTLGGATAYSATNLGFEATATVAGGAYVVEVATATQRKTVKVVVE